MINVNLIRGLLAAFVLSDASKGKNLKEDMFVKRLILDLQVSFTSCCECKIAVFLHINVRVV